MMDDEVAETVIVHTAPAWRERADIMITADLGPGSSSKIQMPSIMQDS